MLEETWVLERGAGGDLGPGEGFLDSENGFLGLDNWKGGTWVGKGS